MNNDYPLIDFDEIECKRQAILAHQREMRPIEDMTFPLNPNEEMPESARAQRRADCEVRGFHNWCDVHTEETFLNSLPPRQLCRHCGEVQL